MAKKIPDIEVLKQYLQGVMERADHHTENVDQVCLALIGGIIWKKDNDPIEVFEREGDMKNVLWVRINDQKYAFSYNHESHAVDMRKGTTRGKTIFSFTNQTTLANIKNCFMNL